jgi:hypothetical protein
MNAPAGAEGQRRGRWGFRLAMALYGLWVGWLVVMVILKR